MIIIIELYFKKNKFLLYFILILIIIVIYLFLNPTIKTIEKEVTKECKTIDNYMSIKVEIKGAVTNPGVYEVKSNDRVIDLINIAGGLLLNANTDYLNLSLVLQDQMVIKIYTNDEIKDVNKVKIVTEYIEKECICPTINNDACLVSNREDLININSSSLEELTTLTGIGQSKAEAIIEYRTNNKFLKIEDIMNVPGIGQSAFDKIKKDITV